MSMDTGSAASEKAFWPTSHWVKPEPTLDDFKRLEEKIDRLIAIVEGRATKYVDARELPRSE